MPIGSLGFSTGERRKALSEKNRLVIRTNEGVRISNDPEVRFRNIGLGGQDPRVLHQVAASGGQNSNPWDLIRILLRLLRSSHALASAVDSAAPNS